MESLRPRETSVQVLPAKVGDDANTAVKHASIRVDELEAASIDIRGSSVGVRARLVRFRNFMAGSLILRL